MDIVRLPASFGVEIRDFDPKTAGLDDFDRLREALARQRILVFRDLALSAQVHVDLLSGFGSVIVEVDDADSLADPEKLFGQVTYVTTRPGEYISGRNGLGFHSDYQFYSDGASAVLSLYAVHADQESPTLFANMIEATGRIPAGLMERLRALNVVQCCNFFHYEPTPEPRNRLRDRNPAKDYGGTAALHPAVGRHRVTGEEMINVCQIFSSHFQGLSYDESDRLFAALEPYQYAKPILYRHLWRTGDLVVWDNIALQHGREPLDEDFTRHLRRVVCNPWDYAQMQRRTRAAQTQWA
jgi:taurine dioxygenase